MTLEEMKAERKALRVSHDRRMKELQEIGKIMKSDPKEALRRIQKLSQP
tara:strand:+ start:111 stop:257 length:147 start_codon:yes stop_codon:yes gene_type:complete